MILLLAHVIIIELEMCPLDSNPILIRKKNVRKAATR